MEKVLPVEHDGFVDGVRHEPLRGLRDVLPQLVVRTVLLLQQAFANSLRKQNPTVEGFVSEMSRIQRTPNRIYCYFSEADTYPSKI